MPAPKDPKKYEEWIRNIAHSSYLKGKTYEQQYGKERAEEIRKKLSQSHKGLKYPDKKKPSVEFKRKRSIQYLRYDIYKYKDLIIKLYKEGKSAKYIGQYIKNNYEPKTTGKNYTILNYLKKWGIEIENRGQFKKGHNLNRKVPIKIKCLYCGKINSVPPSESFRKYCNIVCYGNSMKKLVIKKERISRKNTPYEQQYGKERAEEIKKKLSESHKRIKYPNRKSPNLEYRKRKSREYLRFDIEKYKDLIINMYKRHSAPYIAEYIKEKYEPKSKLHYATIINHLRKWGIKIREANLDKVALSWDKLSTKIAEKLYKTKFKKVVLPNQKMPDWAYNKIKKGFYEVIFDAKAHPYLKSIEKDIENYGPYCNYLEFWCLKGRRKSNNKKVKFVSSTYLIQKLKEINEKELINKILLLRQHIDIYDKKQKTLKDF